ncbi:MAG TPA: acyl-CoA dehydrogenase family protein [Allosphingosinicella sp.]|nr:acyl-CoA dehydrogenase family protein [Allosphingosinicella sp.]
MSNEQSSFSEEDRELFRQSVRRLLSDQWPVLTALELGADQAAIRTIWRELSSLSLPELGRDAEAGGLREILLVFEELGRAACPAPLLGAVMLNMIFARDRSVSESDREAISGGAAALIAVGFGTFDGDLAAGGVSRSGDRIAGSVSFVEGAAFADRFVLFMDHPGGVAIVERGAEGLEVQETPALSIPSLSTVSFAGTPARFLQVDPSELADLAEIARLCCAARAQGSAQRGFDLVVEHVSTRKQFGQFLGQFQAVQHRLADNLTRLDGSRLTLEAAAIAFDAKLDSWRIFADCALAHSSSGLRQLAIDMHQLMGAIGYSEEHELPRHFRQIHGNLTRFGGVLRARAQLAAYLVGGGSDGKLPEFDLDPAVRAFREEVHAWLKQNWTDTRQAAHEKLPFKDRGYDPDFARALGAKGWIGAGWPKEDGGLGLSAAEQLVLTEEMELAKAPYGHIVGDLMIGLSLIKSGSPELKAKYLPGIKSGEMSFALGYSEPEAGSDLASLRTRAVREADGWRINGQKMWSTGADKADYLWLAARTDPDAKPKHAGISVFVVPLSSPGITIRPSLAMYGKTFCEIHFEDLQLPLNALVGEVNQGWAIITGALAAERVTIGGTVALLQRALARLTGYIGSAEVGGRRLRDDPVILDRIGAIAADIEAARQLALRNIRMVSEGRTPIHEASMAKVFVAELQGRLGETSLEILGSGGLLSEDSPAAPVGELEQVLRHTIMQIVGGGTSEIQRNIIAIRGIGLPR